MLLIDKKILIVHMRKCGGTSFCRGLIDILPPERCFYLGYTKESEARSSASYREGGPWKHSTAHEVISKMGLDRENLEVYLVSMRPYWERLASFYLYAVRHHQRDASKYVWVSEIKTISEYLESRFANRDSVPEFACDPDGNTLVDHFVRFESLGSTYSDLCARLGFAGQEIPSLNRNPTVAQNYKGLFSNTDWANITPRFQPEIDFINALPDSKVE